MKPGSKERRVVEVNANQTWPCSLLHRVYSCPDTPAFDYVLGATALILIQPDTGRRVPLEISAVVRVAPDDQSQLEALAQRLRTRLDSYRAAIAANWPNILPTGVAHRFYFLSEEPWPDWLQNLTTQGNCTNLEWTAIMSICSEPERFFEWPQIGELLWPGCTRGDENQLHHYPPEVTNRLLRMGIRQPDTRSNGPAIMAFLAGGGKRPSWGIEGWPIHHIYDGTAPVPGGPPLLHAVNDRRYFTHSGGLVAAHPVAHHLAHQSTLLKWLLRREAYLRFGFDPDGIFGRSR